MDIGIVGLGRMGGGVAARLLQGGHRVVAFNRSPDKIDEIRRQGAEGAYTLEELVASLPAPRRIWLYLPSGEVTGEYVGALEKLLGPGDLVIDGGNSHFLASIERASQLAQKGVGFIDVGTSGGIAGATAGYCLMIGGDRSQVASLAPLWSAVAQPEGWQHVGPAGSGHYVKMVHNAIEYGMMQSYAEGMELLAAGRFGGQLDLSQVARVWQHGSIIRSYLGELLEQAVAEDAALAKVGGRIDDNGEGRWAIEEALDAQVPIPAITAALFVRYRSRREQGYANKVVSALRNKFGGHQIHAPQGPAV